MGACHCCQTFWDPQCQRACGSERSSLETPHRSTALRFARWYRTWWYSQVFRKQRREPLRFRATLRQRPPGNRRRHKTLARNMARAILGDRNCRENLKLLKVTISLPHREVFRVVFPRNFPCARLAQLPRRWLFLPANDLFHAARWFVLRALYLVFGR